MVLLSIIILNYNTKDLTIRCLESLVYAYKKYLEEGKMEIIVVDNKSTDNSLQDIAEFCQKFSFIQFIKNNENSGFSKGNNIAAKKAKGEYLLFLNSDTKVLDDTIWNMVEFIQKNKTIGIVGGKLKNEDGSDQKSSGKFYTLFTVFVTLFGGGKINLFRWSPRDIQEVDWVSGGCMLIKSSLFGKVSGFDEQLFMYIEDMELCYRIKKLRYSVWYYPFVNILHQELGSSNRTFAIVHIYKGIRYFYKKHKNIVEYGIVTMALILKALSAITWGFITNNRYLITTYKQAI